MDEVLNKPQSAEQVEDLEAQMDRARKMRTLIESEGWILLASYIMGGKDGAMKCLRTESVHTEMLRHQQALNTLEALENYIKNTIQMGDAARKQLFPVERDGSTGKTANVQQQS